MLWSAFVGRSGRDIFVKRIAYRQQCVPAGRPDDADDRALPFGQATTVRKLAACVQSIGGKRSERFVQIPVQSGNYYPRHQALRGRTADHRQVA